MPNRKLRIALLGSGFMGRAHSNAYRQLKNFFDVPFDLEMKVICARNREKLERMAPVWGWNEIATDWRSVVERKDIDVVDVALPNDRHAPAAIAAAQAGKIVFCEKPLALTAEEGRRMADAAARVPNMVWFNYRRAPAIGFAKELIEQGRIGQPFHYRATYLQEWGNDPTRPHNWKMERAHAGAGVIGDLLSHVIDTAMWLNGPIRELTAMAHTFAPAREVEDAALLLARFENGSIGSFEATRFGIGCRNRNAFEIHGANGMMRFNLEDMNYLEFHNAAEARNLQGTRRILVTGPDHPYWTNFWKPGHVTGYEHTFIAALGDFLGSLAAGRPFHPDFEDAQRVQAVLDAVERSAQSRQWVQV